MQKDILAVALLAAMTTTTLADDLATRFGPIRIGGEFGNLLSFHGRRLIRGHNPLRAVETFRMGPDDVVLVQEDGGTACPALYYFVRVSASGARATPAFGTCDEVSQVVRKGDRIWVTMPGYRGPFEPPAARAKAAGETHVFTYRAGVVSEWGRIVPSRLRGKRLSSGGGTLPAIAGAWRKER